MSSRASASARSAASIPVETVPLRPPDQVLRLDRLGAAHQTRLSFTRSLLRMLVRERWQFDRPVWRFDATGVGVGVYTATGPERTYSLIAYGHDLAPDQRSDRVIATAWDATFALFDGVPDESDLTRLATEVPRQEAGRLRPTELTLSRANKSVRLFEHTVAALAAGDQPDADQVDATGYLMRTTAVYGSGKFGAADRRAIVDRPEARPSFRIEMLTVWLIRAFTVDLVEHLAANRSPDTAVRLEEPLRQRFGVGNSTGLGMAPFLANHPALLHVWVEARETALARVRSVDQTTSATRDDFLDGLRRARLELTTWHTADPHQAQAIEELIGDMGRFEPFASTLLAADGAQRSRPWDRLYRWAESNLGLEAQELVVSLLIEPHGELVDDLADRLWTSETRAAPIDGAWTVRDLIDHLDHHYSWAVSLPLERPETTARFWYVSEEKLEPRLGERATEPGAERELPLGVGPDVARLREVLETADPAWTIARLLTARPDLRHIVRRTQTFGALPYAEIRDNLVGAALRPVDLLRFKLAYFGASRFDPKSDRWTRITLFQFAPYPDTLSPTGRAYGPRDSPERSRPRGLRQEHADAAARADRPPTAPSEPRGPSLDDTVAAAPSEVESLVLKAARGAGHEWGCAEDLARTARWLSERDLQGAELVASLLGDQESSSTVPTCGPNDSTTAPHSTDAPHSEGYALHAAAALCDRRASLSRGRHRLGSVDPRLFLPYLGPVADTQGCRIRLESAALIAEVGPGEDEPAIATKQADSSRGSGVELVIGWTGDGASSGRVPASEPRTHLAVREVAWRALTDFAHQSYVPATDASRLAGAGAGLLDND